MAVKCLCDILKDCLTPGKLSFKGKIDYIFRQVFQHFIILTELSTEINKATGVVPSNLLIFTN
jgi:hypothetical protein